MSHEIPKKQWAQVIEKTGGPVEYKQIDVQKPGADEVLIHVQYSGVCHTDLHAVNGDWPLPTKLPLVGGHEGKRNDSALSAQALTDQQVPALSSPGASS